MPDPAGSPCIGVCSTTYGDLVCRGCHRFAHEVSEWNGYGDAQRVTVRRRLDQLRSGAAAHCLSAERIEQLASLAGSVRLRRTSGMAPPTVAHEVLRRLVLKRRPPPWLPADDDDEEARRNGVKQGRALLAQIDREMMQRSRAHYEQSFRAPPE